MNRHERSYIFKSIKRFQNPHHYLNEESLRIVSRGDLASDLDEYDEGSNSEIKNDRAISKAISALDELLSPLANEFVSANRGRKRKREEPGISTFSGNANQATEIRLVSRRPAYVTTSGLVDDWPSQPKLYASEDTSDEAAERKRRAAQAAVDFEAINKQSAIPYPDFKKATNSEYRLKDNSALTTIVVVESHKPKQSRALHLRTEVSQLKIRGHKAKGSLVVNARSDHIPPDTRQSNTPFHTFYHSHETVGGKSAGYAWGYKGSFPRSAEKTGYLRDNMRKGLDVVIANGEARQIQATEAKASLANACRSRS